MTAASSDFTMRPGPTNSIVDVPGVRVGHCTRDEPGWLTGVTVVVAPPGGAVEIEVDAIENWATEEAAKHGFTEAAHAIDSAEPH